MTELCLVAEELGGALAALPLTPALGGILALAGSSAANAPALLAEAVAGNALLFVPATFFATLWLRRVRWWALLLAAFGLSVTIELAQASVVHDRVAQTDDVIMNVAGAAIGIGLARLSLRAAERWRRGDSNP